MQVYRSSLIRRGQQISNRANYKEGDAPIGQSKVVRAREADGGTEREQDEGACPEKGAAKCFVMCSKESA
jgi:hypothetical protein